MGTTIDVESIIEHANLRSENNFGKMSRFLLFSQSLRNA